MSQLEFGLAAAAAPRPSPRRPRRRRATPDAPAQLSLPGTVDAVDEDSPFADLLEDLALEAADPTAPSPLGPEALVPSVRGQSRVEAALRERLGPKVLVKLTTNRHTMVSFKRQRGVLYVRLHALFQHAPERVLDAVASYLEPPEPGPGSAEAIDGFLERHRDLVEQNRAERLVVHTDGAHHDLRAIFDELNADYFGGGVTARITWSRAQRGQQRASMRLGSYCDVQNVIRMHPALDQAFVPRYFVASVVFHEMLHEVHGAEEISPGRRSVHTEAFVADERRFADYDRARRWESKHIRRLLRY